MTAIGRMTSPYSWGLNAPKRVFATFQIKLAFSCIFLPVDAMRSLLVVMCSILSNDGQFLIHACVQKRIILCQGKG